MSNDNNEILIVCSCCGHERIVKSDAYSCPECNEVAHVAKKYIRFNISFSPSAPAPAKHNDGVWEKNIIRASHRFKKK